MFDKMDGATIIITGANVSLSSFSTVLNPKEPLVKSVQSQRSNPLRCLQQGFHIHPAEICSVKAAGNL